MIFKHGLAVIRDGKLLLVKKKGVDLLITPGGKPEKGENNIECIEREIMEELGTKIEMESIELFGTFEDVTAESGNETVRIEMYLGRIKGNPKPSREIEKIFWIDSKTNPSKLSPIVRNRILPALIREGYVK
ncbi:MAG: NUDIX domain-containing protein [Candidatus Aenigmarchaeota archaeon]|nr:NUDIX domain-containing protein [Candidatus Aenigmarchaeota archaeon]